jgi:hypothetical protein
MEPHAIVAALAAMTDAEVAESLAAARGDAEPVDPKGKAAAALRRHRGADRTARATKAEAAAAVRRYTFGRS